MAGYEYLDHTADAGIRARGRTVEEVFTNAAKGMTNLMVDPRTISEKIHREIAIQAADQEELLVSWLNELLYLFDAESLIFRRFKIINLGERNLRAVAFGEKLDPARHEVKTPVKAATYHQLKIERTEDGFTGQVILDI